MLPACGWVRIWTDAKCRRSAAGATCTWLLLNSWVGLAPDTVPIGIPAGYREVSGPALNPEVTTLSPTAIWAVPGRSWSRSWLGLPTDGAMTPVSPARLRTWAATANAWSVNSVTTETDGSTVVTSPASAPSATTGSFMVTPSSDPASTVTCWYHRLGSRPITLAATRW